MTHENREQIISIVQEFINRCAESVANSGRNAESLLDDMTGTLSVFITIRGVDESELMACVKELLPANYYAEFEKELAEHLAPYHQLTFLRSLDELQQIEILSTVYEDMLCHKCEYSDLCEKLSITDKQFNSVLMLVHTFLRIIIGERYALEFSKRLVREMTGLSFYVADAFVNLFDGNSEILRDILLNIRLSRLERKLNPIIEFMDEIREDYNIEEQTLEN